MDFQNWFMVCETSGKYYRDKWQPCNALGSIWGGVDTAGIDADALDPLSQRGLH